MGLKISTLHVRRSIYINASPGRVWREFESTERIMGWLNLGHSIHKFEPQVGGEVEMSVNINGEDRYYGGPVLIVEPEQEISFESQWQEPYQWPVPTLWTIRLSPLYNGTMVEIFHHGFERMGAAAADNLQDYESGWDIKHLKALREIVEK